MDSEKPEEPPNKSPSEKYQEDQARESLEAIGPQQSRAISRRAELCLKDPEWRRGYEAMKVDPDYIDIENR